MPHPGGRILEDGDVIFPDKELFEKGRGGITLASDHLLVCCCRFWFARLPEGTSKRDKDTRRNPAVIREYCSTHESKADLRKRYGIYTSHE